MKKLNLCLSLISVALFFSCSKTKDHSNVQADRVNDSLSVYHPISPELFKEIYTQDSLMFAAFNAHDSVALMRFFSDDMEFYHDKGGLSDFKGTAYGFHRLFENNKETGLRRDLVAGSMEVYPINEYGAVETCQHRFCHLENGKDDCGTFKNIMIWKKTAADWKVTRVISYDHK
jgi:Domain of unknown function (DUF4440)